MKTKILALVTLPLLCLFAICAQANIVLQDNFDSYAVGNLTNNSGGFWSGHSGVAPINVVADDSVSAPNALQITRNLAQDVNATLTNAPYYTAGTNALQQPATTLYYKFTLRMSSADLPTSAGTYFAHLKDTGNNFRGKAFALTSGAAAGNYRVGIANSANSPSATWDTDLLPDTTYVVIVRYVVTNAVSTLWINPTKESDTSITASDSSTPINISTMAFRQASGEGTMNVDDLVVGTNFADILSGRPLVVQEPDDTISFVGASVSFSTASFGTQPMSYQWYHNTNTLVDNLFYPGSGATSNVLVLTNLALGESGTYSCVATNIYGTNVTRFASLAVFSAPLAPVITNQPAAGSTNIVGDDVTFSVVAGGVPPPAYQWEVIANGVTNNVTGANVSGANSDTLVLTGVTTNQTGVYFVTITNVVGTTNSSLANLLVNPSPVLTVANLRSMVDSGTYLPTNTSSIFITEGIVTTWTNMTGSANCEFYMQDGTGGIVVFWAGSNGTNLPPAGADVRVYGRLSSFHGLIELTAGTTDPQTSVQVVSTNNPLPAAQPLPFDPNVTGNHALMEQLEGTYFVASNVTLAAGSTFGSGVNEGLTNNTYHVRSDSLIGLNFTNNAGDVATLYLNFYTDIPGKPKPNGPVTIYGVLGNFDGLYEFTPTRYADVISYIHVTNAVTHVKHYGDLLTNTYTENVLRPGETQTTFESIGDADGGSVTLTPVPAGLPGTASWSDITGGATGTAVFHFTPAVGDSGSNYLVSLHVTSTSGSDFTNTITVYVPTLNEQKMAITEFLANPTTNTAAANFNPLHRSSDTDGVKTNDEFIEIVNQSLSSQYLYGWGIYNESGTLVQDFSIFGPTLNSSNAYVVYGGGSSAPSLPASSENATSGGLSLATTGTGTIVLRNYPGGNIIDRVVYSASDLNTNGSLTRFPTMDSPFVPQAYVSTNRTTAGLQYDGSAWNKAFKVPTGVTNITVSVAAGQAALNFTADPTLGTTLWSADRVTGPYSVLFGQQFPTTSGSFTTPASAPLKFYYISNQ